jgi:hypothetical protein
MNNIRKFIAIDDGTSLILRFSSLRTYLWNVKQYENVINKFTCGEGNNGSSRVYQIMPTKELVSLLLSKKVLSKDPARCAINSAYIGEHSCVEWRSLFGLEYHKIPQSPLELVSKLRTMVACLRCFDGASLGGDMKKLVKYYQQCSNKNRLMDNILACVLHTNNTKHFTPAVVRLFNLAVERIEAPPLRSSKNIFFMAISRTIYAEKMESLKFLNSQFAQNPKFRDKFISLILTHCLCTADITLIKRFEIDDRTIRRIYGDHHPGFFRILSFGNHYINQTSCIMKYLYRVLGAETCLNEIRRLRPRFPVVSLCLQIELALLSVGCDLARFRHQAILLSGCTIDRKDKTQLKFISNLKPEAYYIIQGKMYSGNYVFPPTEQAVKTYV